MSVDAAFANSPSTFSYRWPEEKASQMWRYFYEGWLQRDQRISQALKEDQNARVLLVDVKSFYPSANGRSCLQQFSLRLQRSRLDATERKIVTFAVEQTIREGGNSIPIGPPMGHALANIFLTEIDKLLNEKFPGRYLRYVDDIAIIVPKEQVRNTELFVEDILGASGLNINKSKTRVVGAYEWGILPDHSALESFGKLRSMLVAHLAIRRNSAEEIKARFLNEGFNLPIDEMSYSSKGAPYINYLTKLFLESPSDLIAGLSKSISELILYAAKLRSVLKRRIEEDLRINLSDLPYADAKRKRRIRNETARLAYLLPLGDTDFLRDSLHQGDSADLIALFDACRSGDVTELLDYPGPTVRTFGQLWSSGSQRKATARWERRVRQQQRDATANLLLWDVVDPPSDQKGLSLDPFDRALFHFCAGIGPSTREFFDLSYLDEIRSLQIGHSAKINKYLFDRYDASEMPIIEGLSIAGRYS